MGTRLNRLAEAVLTSTHNLCFEQKFEKYQSFVSENFQFLEVKFSIYLNRRVFIMNYEYTGCNVDNFNSLCQLENILDQLPWIFQQREIRVI